MGGCFSDVNGGQAAVGVGSRGGLAGPPLEAAQQELNDAVDHFLHTHGLRGLYIPLELSLSASKLLDLDVLSKSDPMAVIYAKKLDGMLEELGRTEVIMNTLNPAWITKFTINYHFEMVQPLVFRVYDIDTKYHNTSVKMLKLNEQDYLGEASCALSEIVTKHERSLTLKLKYRNSPPAVHLGTITVHAEETVASRTAVEMIVRCCHLENKDVFSKSDPFIRISRVVESGISIPVCKTEVVNNNLNPVWKPITLTMQQFGSKENPLIIECFDFNANGKHALLGELQGSMAELEKLSREKIGAHFYVPSSVRQGHKKVVGVEGIMSSYAMALHNVILAGPTLFGPVINKAAAIASKSLSYSHNKYFVLLIITDGVITDAVETKDAIVKASDLPLSILIVGVGGADFKQMEILDADDGKRLESSTGRIATRDIVQFVPMWEMQGRQISIVQSLLEELPGQFLTYVRSRDIKPIFAHPAAASASQPN
ncbi:protein BONZAI 3 isoform X2 [Elaeis guineensis]|uniref:protein BONZAI 3 isoform X2 n=1 Tax=Elaeis guineensis var. tenera TaxID=51953 RepID=UPI000579EFC2